MLTDQESEKLVQLIASGKNTYADIKHDFPLDWPDRYLYIDDYFKDGVVFVGHPLEKIGLIEFEIVPEEYSKEYRFKDEDKFRLTIKGRNLYNKCIREERLYLYTKIAAFASVVAALATVIMPLLIR